MPDNTGAPPQTDPDAMTHNASSADMTDDTGVTTTPVAGPYAAGGGTSGGFAPGVESAGSADPGTGNTGTARTGANAPDMGTNTGGITTGGPMTGGTLGGGPAAGGVGTHGMNDEGPSRKPVMPGANDAAPANPNATDPGVTGVIPTGGGQAVPDRRTMEDSATLGDTDSMDDAGGPQGANRIGNADVDAGAASSGPSVDRIAPGDTSGGADAGGGGVPTGALNAGGTIGGVPTGETGVGMGDEGR